MHDGPRVAAGPRQVGRTATESGVARVDRLLHAGGMSGRVRHLADSARTAADAARALGSRRGHGLGGHPCAAFSATSDELQALTGGRWADVGQVPIAPEP